MSMNSQGPRVALVIGSGSVKCAAALGLMKVLERENIRLDLIVGCSGGAIYAACIALGWTVPATTEATLHMWTRQVTEKRTTNKCEDTHFPQVVFQGGCENCAYAQQRKQL